VLLSREVLDAIRRTHDVLVIAPFADDADFQAQFAGPHTAFLSLQNPVAYRRKIAGRLYGVSEMMRLQGYYASRLRAGMRYYMRFERWDIAPGRPDRPKPRIQRLALALLGALGRRPAAWRTLDRFAGSRMFELASFARFLRPPRAVTLIQCASFGEQDRALAWAARRYGMGSVLIPYTSDQLTVNGHLLADYDAVCVQGPREERAARDLHGVPASALKRMGSVWFRQMKRLQADLAQPSPKSQARVILYAGVASLYFPRDAETLAVDALAAEIASGRLGKCEIVYRPVATDAAELATLQSRYAEHASVRLQVPQAACVGMGQASARTIEDELREYVHQLLESDVVVMSNFTSLALDAACLGIGSVSNCADPTGTLARRGNDDFLAADFAGYRASGFPVAHSIPQLIEAVRDILAHPGDVAERARRFAADWDFPDADVAQTLRAVLESPPAPDDVSREPTTP
jgi:hypothetical protein